MLLAIDTATAACSVALIERGEIIDERHEAVGRGHAERLVPMLDEMLQERRPTAIAVDCGPGSFTGVRVGLAAAHGLAIGWEVPVIGFSSLALLAASCGAAEAAVALHGGHGEIFVQIYGGDPLRSLGALRSLSPEAAAAEVRTHLVVGTGAEALVAARGWGEAIDILPRAADVRLLPPDLCNLIAKPIYGRDPDAKPMQ